MNLGNPNGFLMALVCAAALATAAGGARGAMPGPTLEPRTNVNPGLLYWQAFGSMPRLKEGDGKILDQFVESLAAWSNGKPEAVPVKIPADADSILEPYGRSLQLLQKARLSLTPCDWGADPSDGPYMLIPDTRGLRELTKVSLLKAAALLESGRAEESVDTLLSCLSLARNFARDGTLVSVALEQRAEDQLVDYLGAQLGAYPAGAVALLRQGLSSLPARVPVAVGVESERSFQSWMMSRVDRQADRYPGDDQKAYAASRQILEGVFKIDGPALDKAAGMSIKGLRRLLNDLGPFYDAGRTIATAGPDTLEQPARALEEGVEGSGNPIAFAAIPNFGRARRRELANLARWAMMEASLAQAVGGDPAFQNVPDPLSGKPFRVQDLGKGVFELRSHASLGAGLDPILQVQRATDRSR